MYRYNIRNIFLKGIKCLVCLTEQTAVQVEQTERGVCSPLPPPRHKRICIYGVLPRLPLGNAALFLNRQGHQQLSFSGRQHICACTITHAHLDVYTKTKLTFPIPPLHSLFWQWDRQARSCPLIKHTSPCLFLLVHCRCCPSKALIKTAWLKQLIKMEKLCLCHLGLELHRDSGKCLLRGRILWKESAALC